MFIYVKISNVTNYNFVAEVLYVSDNLIGENNTSFLTEWNIVIC